MDLSKCWKGSMTMHTRWDTWRLWCVLYFHCRWCHALFRRWWRFASNLIHGGEEREGTFLSPIQSQFKDFDNVLESLPKSAPGKS